MGNHSRGYINRDGRAAGGRDYPTQVRTSQEAREIELNYEGLPVTLAPERVQTEVVGPIAAVIRLWAFLICKDGGDGHAKMHLLREKL